MWYVYDVVVVPYIDAVVAVTVLCARVTTMLVWGMDDVGCGECGACWLW